MRTIPPEINALQDQQEVTYRVGRAGRNSVEWEPWTNGTSFA